MSGTGSVFGRPGGTSSIRSSVMNSASLNATPSPSSPADVVENPTLQGYYRLYTSCGECLAKEKDPLRRLELEKVRTFADTVIRDIEGQDASAGPPAPMPGLQQPPAMAMPGAAPPAGPPAAAPPAAPGGPSLAGAGAGAPGAA